MSQVPEVEPMDRPLEDGYLDMFIRDVGWRNHKFSEMDDRGWHMDGEHISVSLDNGMPGSRIVYYRPDVVVLEVVCNSPAYLDQMRKYREQHGHYWQMQTDWAVDPEKGPFAPPIEVDTGVEYCVTDKLGNRGCGATRQEGVINCG